MLTTDKWPCNSGFLFPSFYVFMLAGLVVLFALIRLQFIVKDIEGHERAKAKEWALHVQDVSVIQKNQDSTKLAQVPQGAKRIQNIAAIESERDALEKALKSSEESYFKLIQKTYKELFNNNTSYCGTNVSFEAILNNNTSLFYCLILRLARLQLQNLPGVENEDSLVAVLNQGGIASTQAYLNKEFRFAYTMLMAELRIPCSRYLYLNDSEYPTFIKVIPLHLNALFSL